MPTPWLLVSLLALLVGCDGSRSNRGKFNLKDGMQCSWTAKDANNAVVKLRVKCENPVARVHGGITDVECEYRAKPQSCPGYQSNAKGYYKQVSRALKKLQGKLCRDERTLAKAGMCKRAPQDAHFKLDIRTSHIGAQSGGDTILMPTSIATTTTTSTQTARAPNGTAAADCKGRADHRQVAQEYCSSSWASVCAFFFSIVQSDDC